MLELPIIEYIFSSPLHHHKILVYDLSFWIFPNKCIARKTKSWVMTPFHPNIKIIIKNSKYMGIVYFTNNKKLQKVSKAIYAYSTQGHQTKTSWMRLAWWPCLATWGNVFRIPFLSSNGEKTGTFFLFSSYTSSLLSPKKKYVTRIRIWNFSNILHLSM